MKFKRGTPANTLELLKKVCPRYKRSQEEMVGFAFIIIIVAVIMVIFLSLSTSNDKKEPVQSHEVESFLGSALQYTTDCRNVGNREFYTIQKLILECDDGEKCLDSRDICDVLNNTFAEILEESWSIGADKPLKGYLFSIIKDDTDKILVIEEGNRTNNYRGGVEFLHSDIDIGFTIYS